MPMDATDQFWWNWAVNFGVAVATVAAVLLFYLITFRFLGFMLATTLAVYAAARTVGSTWMEGLLTGLITSIFFYGIFHFLLQVPLPLGYIFKVIG